MVAKFSSRASRRYQIDEVSSDAAAGDPRHEQAEVELKRDQAEENGRKDGDGGGEGEDEDSEEDCFFESNDRVSVCFNLPSDSDDDDDDDDVRISFSSAVGPPINFRCVTHSREDFLAELREQEAASLHLHQGTGFRGRKGIKSMRKQPPVDEPLAKNPLTKAARPRRPVCPQLPPSASAQEAAERLADSTVKQQPEEPLEHPAQLAMRRSESDLPSRQVFEDVPVRCASAPASLCDLFSQEDEEEAVGRAAEGGAVAADGVDNKVAGEASRSKDLEQQKELAAEGTTKEGSKRRINDFQNGKHSTRGKFERFLAIPKAPKPPKQQMYKRKGGWFKNIKHHVSSSVGRITEKDKATETGSKAAGKAPGESSPELMKVHQHGKSTKEFTGLYMSQEIDAHQGSIWSIKFSLDGRYLASTGEDRIVQVWQVQETPTHELRAIQPKPDTAGPTESLKHGGGGSSSASLPTKKTLKRNKSKKRGQQDYIVIPEAAFGLSEKPFCSFEGHGEDVLDLSWSKSSQHLLSSSMDKTVRLWNIETKSCIKLFVHNDYVTCIQFNPTDDRYFISGSLDAKVRIWNVPDRQVVDCIDLQEMVTAVSYTPDGQGAFVGSHRGNCRIYKISENKLSQESMIEIKRKKKKYTAKKITGMQFAPNSQTEVMITSADSQIRVFDDLKIIHKYRGFRNISSQIAASYTSDGRYVVSASEDSNVYVWKRDGRSAAGKGKATATTRSHENFFCKDVSMAIPWPSAGSSCPPLSLPVQLSQREAPTEASAGDGDGAAAEDPGYDISNSIGNESFVSVTGSIHAGEAESSSMSSSKTGGDHSNAWGLVVVTAGLGGQIRVFQNFGTPARLSRQVMF